MSRSRYTAEERVRAATEYLLGRRSAKEIGKDLNVDPRTLRDWARLLSESGEAIFIEKKRNQRYSAALKRQAVEEYISGGGSILSICIKYGIHSKCTLNNWIKQYNSNMKLTDYDPKPEVYMATARRKTTIDERREIVEYCLSHDKDYKGAADKYDVSYSQV